MKLEDRIRCKVEEKTRRDINLTVHAHRFWI